MYLLRAAFASMLLLTVGLSHADGLDSLATFVKSTRSGRADFTQVVTAPGKDGQALKRKTSSGSFEFLRPNRFRFHYTKPFEQSIVADGQTLWLYDPDLNQVTARQQAQALSSTPAALIASAADLKALQTEFTLQSAPDKNGLQWALATPKVKDSQLVSIRIGFGMGPKGPDLAALEIEDSFGQRSTLSFANMQSNAAIGPEAFAFKPPVGADVIRP